MRFTTNSNSYALQQKQTTGFKAPGRDTPYFQTKPNTQKSLISPNTEKSLSALLAIDKSFENPYRLLPLIVTIRC